MSPVPTPPSSKPGDALTPESAPSASADDLRRAMKTARRSATALRSLERGRNPNGHPAATDNAITRHQDVRAAALDLLTKNGQKEVAGLLEEESGLLDRLAESVDRPELKSRLGQSSRGIDLASAQLKVTAALDLAPTGKSTANPAPLSRELF